MSVGCQHLFFAQNHVRTNQTFEASLLAVVSVVDSLSGIKATPAASMQGSDTASKEDATARPDEDMSFFLNKNFIQQNSDYSKMHVISFTDTDFFIYMIFDGRTGGILARYDGRFSCSGGQVLISFTDNSVLRLKIKKEGQYRIGIQTGESLYTTYAEWLSPEDLFTQNALVCWSYYGSGSNTGNYNTNMEQQPKRICAYCNGTGKSCVLRTVPTYGTNSYSRNRCRYCGQWLVDGVVHVLQNCSMCGGTGYR